MLAVQSGVKECLVRLAFAPNTHAPLDIHYEMSGRGERQRPEFFEHAAMTARCPAELIGAGLGQGAHFWDRTLPWNGIKVERGE